MIWTSPQLEIGPLACFKLHGADGTVARVFGVHHSTVVRLVEHYHTTGSSNDHPRSSRSHVTTAAQDRANRLSHLRDRFHPATRTAAETIGTHHRLVSARTIRNRLRADGIRPYRPYVGSVLTPQHRRARVQWCNVHRHWTLQRWSQVLFSDEKEFHQWCGNAQQGVQRAAASHLGVVPPQTGIKRKYMTLRGVEPQSPTQQINSVFIQS
uniref:Transposase Tc1-like domain-containing protein n=1 Tax=Sphaeramia orbicularis TaxID=375764 RepID=A0A673AQ28_9TELE